MRKSILLLLFFITIFSCSTKESLIIFHAGSLSKPMADLTEAFIKRFPAVKIKREAAGSRETARKISELYRSADILAVADYLVIEDLLMPNYIDWYINFTSNKMVIAFTEKSMYASEINDKNWFHILARDDVRFGRSDENLDPCGYRALMVWQLADLYYKEKINGENIYETLDNHCPQSNIRPGSIELLPLLESLSLDYAFEYFSVAVQHRLRYIKLPEEIDLSNPEKENYYNKAKVNVTGTKRGKFTTVIGTPITYAISVPKDAPNRKMALEFMKLVMSEEGREILTKNGQPSIVPPEVSNIDSIPNELRKAVE